MMDKGLGDCNAVSADFSSDWRTSPGESYYSSWYDRIRKDFSNHLYKERRSSSSAMSSSSMTGQSWKKTCRKNIEAENLLIEEVDLIKDKEINNFERLDDLEEIKTKLECWVKQMSTQHSDPFFGLDPEEQSPVSKTSSIKTDPYWCLCWDTREEFLFERWEGSVDNEGHWNGRGVITLGGSGGEVVTTWRSGRREGKYKCSSPKNGIVHLLGECKAGRMVGLGKLIKEDGSIVDGFFRDGCLHGMVRILDARKRLMWAGRYVSGRASGVCWAFQPGGGSVTGTVDKEGNFTGESLAYIYPDYVTALVGQFKDGYLVTARASTVTALTMSEGVPVLEFGPVYGPLLTRELATEFEICTNLTNRDPYEAKMIEVRQSRVERGGEGVYAVRDLLPNTVIAFYNGLRLSTAQEDSQDSWEDCSYRIFLHLDTEEEEQEDTGERMDIPENMRDISQYCATLAHKVNHSFNPNCKFSYYSHPLYGSIPCVVTIQPVLMGEELYCYYKYLLSDCPEWYVKLWES